MVAVIALIILAIAMATGILAVVTVRKRKEEGKPQTQYRTFFILGVIWVPFSIILMVVSIILMVVSILFQIPFYIGFPFFVIGLVYLIIGLKNRDKWKKL